MKRFAGLILTLVLAAGAAWAQDQTGPMRTPSGPPIIHRIPLYGKVPPPPVAPDQIIARFTANEKRNKAEYQKYGFLQTIRVEELGTGGGPTGSYQVEVEVFAKPGGSRYERILKRSKSSLQYLKLSTQDLEVLAAMPAFPLAEGSSAYNFTYRGTEKEGDLMTYAFQVEPKSVQPGHLYFSGVVWVDNVDLAIVKSYGHFVSTSPKLPGALPFSFYTTYRENVTGTVWFPSYIRSNDYYQIGNNELPIRLIVRSRDFHPGQPQIPPPKAR